MRLLFIFLIILVFRNASANPLSCAPGENTNSLPQVESFCQLQCVLSAQSNQSYEPPKDCARNERSVRERIMSAGSPWTLLAGCLNGSFGAVAEGIEGVVAPQAFQEFVAKCRSDDSCRVALARGLEKYRVKGSNGVYAMTDEEVSQATRQMGFNELLTQSNQNQLSTLRLCERKLSEITRELGAEFAKVETSEQEAVKQVRFERLAAYDPDCPRLLKFEDPAKGAPATSGVTLQSAARATVEGIASDIEKWFSNLQISYQCYDSKVQAKLACYGLTQVLLLKSLSARGKLADKSRALVGQETSAKVVIAGSKRQQAIAGFEKAIGRKLTSEDLSAIDRAHRVGDGELGRNGQPAGVGNYNVTQLRRKYRELQGRFSPSEIRDLVKREIVGTNPNAGTVEKVFDDLQTAERSTMAIETEVDASVHTLSSLPEYQNFRKSLADLGKRREEIFEKWNPDADDSTRKTQNDLENLNQKVNRTQGEWALWQKRASENDWSKLRAEPKAVAPNKTYQLQTDRGESLKVRFSDNVVREMFWGDADVIRERAGQAVVEAIGRGYSGTKSGNGLSVLNLDGKKIIKVQIIGRAVGAYRVYGVERNGVIHFVNWEHEGEHGAQYLSRALRNTERSFEAYQKALGAQK